MHRLVEAFMLDVGGVPFLFRLDAREVDLLGDRNQFGQIGYGVLHAKQRERLETADLAPTHWVGGVRGDSSFLQ